MSAVFPSSPSLQSTICHHYQCREAACHRSSSIPSLIPMIVSIFLITLPKIWDPYLPCSSYIFLKFSEKKKGHPSIGGCESQSVTMTCGIPVMSEVRDDQCNLTTSTGYVWIGYETTVHTLHHYTKACEKLETSHTQETSPK